MNLGISSALDKFGLRKPQNIYQAIAKGKVTPEFGEEVKSAKKSAAFFKSKYSKEAEEEMLKKAALKKAEQTAQNVNTTAVNQKKSIFGSLKDSKIGQKSAKVYHSVADKTNAVLSKSSVKKGLKYGAIGLLALGGLALVGYLGKKAYDAYQNRKNASDATTNPTPSPVASSGVHEVKKGDNVWNIAKKELGEGATNAEIAKRTAEIMELNNLKYANDKGLVIIRPGEELKLSA
jgi:LysM repeat protein